MPRYNIALLPPKNIAEKLYKFSDTYFSIGSDGYLLKINQAIPHITLCQFKTESDLNDIAGDFSNLDYSHLNLNISGFYVQHTHSENHQNHIWCGFSVSREPPLIMLQADVSDILHAHKCDVRTGSFDAYFPHLTIARLPLGADIPKLSSRDLLFDKEVSGWSLSIGLSDENGQYLSVIKEL